MCVIVWRWAPEQALVLTLWANRDEWLERPTLALAPWPEHPDFIGGRDLKAGGAWLLVDRRQAAVAAVTNLRETVADSSQEHPRPSRGHLAVKALQQSGFSASTEPFEAYAGFNLIVFKTRLKTATYFSQSARSGLRLEAGTGSIANGRLGAKWPKQQQLEAAIDLAQGLDGDDWLNSAWEALSNQTQPDSLELPDTGVGRVRELELAPVFINTPTYGTRQSTVLRLWANGKLDVRERSWSGHGGQLRYHDVVWNS
ncbi:MAG: NRDE family protein [Betaproteobacteria bacterium]|nr:NRDE family protein [Betaproteobacteria bacterium]